MYYHIIPKAFVLFHLFRTSILHPHNHNCALSLRQVLGTPAFFISLMLLSSTIPIGVWAPFHYQNDFENKCTLFILRLFCLHLKEKFLNYKNHLRDLRHQIPRICPQRMGLCWSSFGTQKYTYFTSTVERFNSSYFRTEKYCN